MKRHWIGLGLALGLVLASWPVAAQQVVKPCVSNAQGGCVNVSATNPLTSGAAVRKSPTWTVQTAAYSSGNSLGGLLTIPIALFNGESGFLTNLRITDKHADTAPTMTVFVFDSNPTGVGSFACTDKAAFVNDPGVIHYQVFTPQNVTLSVPTGATYSYTSIDLSPPRPFTVASTTKNLYACVVVQGSLTPNAASDFYMDVGAVLQ